MTDFWSEVLGEQGDAEVTILDNPPPVFGRWRRYIAVDYGLCDCQVWPLVAWWPTGHCGVCDSPIRQRVPRLSRLALDGATPAAPLR